MYPHLDTALALSRSEQASLASINKELLQRNAQLRTRMRDLDELLVSRDKALDSSARSASNTIATLQQSVMLMDQRLLKYQQRLATQDEALASAENRLQASERERNQAQSDRAFLGQQLEQQKRTSHEEIMGLKSRHQLELQRLQDELTGEISRLREQMIAEQRIQSQVQAEKQVLASRNAALEADRAADRKALVETMAALERARGDLAESQREADQANSRAEALSLTATQQAAQISALTTRVQSLMKQLHAANDEIATWRAEAEAHHKGKLEAEGQLQRTSERLDSVAADLQAQTEATSAMQRARQDALQLVEAERAEVALLSRRIAVKEGELAAAAQRTAESDQAVRLMSKREESLLRQISEQRATHQDSVDQIQAARAAEIDVLREKARHSEQSLHELRHKLRTAQAELNVAIDTNEAESSAADAMARRVAFEATPSRKPVSASSFAYRPASAVAAAALAASAAPLSSSYSSSSSAAALGRSGLYPASPARVLYAGPSSTAAAINAAAGALPSASAFGGLGMVSHGGPQTQVTTTTMLGSDAPPVRIDITPLKQRYPRD